MLVLIAMLLALIPAIVIAYPFMRESRHAEITEDESSTQAELARRFDAAIAALRNTELEAAIGNLADEDYRWLREQHMTEAALAMKAMELEEEQERELLATIGREVEAAQSGLRADETANPPHACPHCSAVVQPDTANCPECGQPVTYTGRESASGADHSQEANGD